MNRRNLIDAIALIVIMCGLAIWNGVLGAKNDLKQNRTSKCESKKQCKYFEKEDGK